MKAHLAKLSLALLSTVFLLGCQEQGSEPVGPEGPQLSHKPKHNPGGGGGGKTDLAVTYTIHTGEGTYVPTSPTFTTNRLIGEGCELAEPILLDMYEMVRCAQVQRVKGGMLTEIQVWVTQASGRGWQSGRLPVDPAVKIFDGFTFHFHLDNVVLSKTHDKNAPSPGTISVVDLVYTAR